MATSMKKPRFKTVTKEDVLEKMEHAEPVQIVNVLAPEHYHLGVIKGSIRIPLNELDSRWGELDKNIEVITYCASYDCPASSQAAEKLANKGFKANAYEGGIKEWKEAGLPLE